ncbi:MAG TPA: response regulator transcription factor [Trinickia sp.]|jgi:DNA-binding response OmpR family regulator/DNA-binding CsgD family transcriptional regulator|uniref:response regulator transcription factor n=1 Tax=Trinickia sp. TaxID=2571163 RepID=UPI002C53E5CB|nr:response regulator transcription factor [Trinickia sp.]HTI18862.1 response regulator transcription factor [Trinickia sp.]
MLEHSAYRSEAAPPHFAGDRTAVLIVDDTPDNLALLSDTLHAAGYAVLVAQNGEAALKCLSRVTPDVVLMDAMMPGMDGFETCRQLKLDTRHAHLPVIFMTALVESEHVVKGFHVGGIDYVTKPVKPAEVCARIAAHVQRSRAQQYADAVLGLETRAAVITTADGLIRWKNPQATRQLARYGDAGSADNRCATEAGTSPARLPGPLCQWLLLWTKEGGELPVTYESNENGIRRTARLTRSAVRGEWVMILEEFDDVSETVSLVSQFGITTREAEVLLWLSRGKTNRDIGDILDMAPRTVNKHLEHLFRKLHVETRSAAAALAIKAGGRH